MLKAKEQFEAIMRGKGHTDFTRSEKGRYVNNAMQVRWSYFLLGWGMRVVA